MIASTPAVQPASKFFMNAVLLDKILPKYFNCSTFL